MELLLFSLFVLTVFLFGAWLIAMNLSVHSEDQNATYPLFAVRDAIIDAVVFKGVPRDDPWVESLYYDLNGMLRNSLAVAGPRGWPLAEKIGHHLADDPSSGKHFPDFPEDTELPAALEPVIRQLWSALDHLLVRHHGFRLQRIARQSRIAKNQRAKAKALQDRMRQKLPSGLIPA